MSTPLLITKIARRKGLRRGGIELHGDYQAKIKLDCLKRFSGKKNGK
jgi:formyltetrahydrofolate synthetase